jgi:hypothetical protein
MNITAKSSKADIIDSAIEIVDHQQDKINQLEQRQLILFGIIGVFVISSLI